MAHAAKLSMHLAPGYPRLACTPTHSLLNPSNGGRLPAVRCVARVSHSARHAWCRALVRVSYVLCVASAQTFSKSCVKRTGLARLLMLESLEPNINNRRSVESAAATWFKSPLPLLPRPPPPLPFTSPVPPLPPIPAPPRPAPLRPARPPPRSLGPPTGGEVDAPPMLFGQIRCFGVNATSPRAREPGSTCGDLIQAYLLVSSMAQAATLSMYPSSWISKIGMHANTFRIESFEFSQFASVTQLN